MIRFCVSKFIFHSLPRWRPGGSSRIICALIIPLFARLSIVNYMFQLKDCMMESYCSMEGESMTIGDLTNRGDRTAKFASYAPPSKPDRKGAEYKWSLVNPKALRHDCLWLVILCANFSSERLLWPSFMIKIANVLVIIPEDLSDEPSNKAYKDLQSHLRLIQNSYNQMKNTVQLRN